jgi:hypothetical protein
LREVVEAIVDEAVREERDACFALAEELCSAGERGRLVGEIRRQEAARRQAEDGGRTANP